MALQIEQRDRQDILILALIGHLTMGPEDAEFRTVVQNCIANGKINIMLDCSRLGKIDTVGLGSLVYCQIKARRAGGRSFWRTYRERTCCSWPRQNSKVCSTSSPTSRTR